MILIYCALFLAFASPATAGPLFTRTQVLMGNVPITITIDTSAGRKDKALTAMGRAFDEVRRIEAAVSEWQPDSETSRLNRCAGKCLVPIGRDLNLILQESARISTMTEGAFDITFASRKKNISWKDVVVIPELGLAYLKPGVKIGVSGIAKGYIVDQMATVLRKAGFRKFLVNAGDLYAAGKWKIGIQNPNYIKSAGVGWCEKKFLAAATVRRQNFFEATGPNSEINCKLGVKNQAVSTSGLYERGHHIVDPRTHRAVKSTVLSVTVVASSSMRADALGTGLFVRPELFEKHPEWKGIVIGSDGKAKTYGDVAGDCPSDF